MRLASFVARRLAFFAVALVGVAVITFVMTRMLPGNPAYLIAGRHADQATIDAVTRRLGLDRPLPEQFGSYMRQLAGGDLGSSARTGGTVRADMAARWPATVELGTYAMLLAVAWSVGLGVLSSLKRRSALDRVANVLSGVGVSVPEFWLGLILVMIFFTTLGWAPPPLGRISGDVQAPVHTTGLYTVDAVVSADWPALWASLRQLALPAITLAFVVGAPMLRVTRTFMREVLRSEYIRAARALGVGRRSLILRHALPNALLPVTTMMAMMYGYLLGGTVLVEFVFAWPGIGKYAVDSINASDYAPVMAVVLLSAVTYLLVYLVTDVLQLVTDPRTRA
jgi:peptide/nickel transport system permease protein